MWSLGKVVQTPEACRVYLGSFWEAPLKLEDNRALLEREKADLLAELTGLPQNAIVRRINDLVKRARAVKVHAYIIHYLRKQMPYMMGKSEKQSRLIDRLDKEFVACARRYNLPLGDFPPVDKYRRMLSEVKDISDFKVPNTYTIHHTPHTAHHAPLYTIHQKRPHFHFHFHFHRCFPAQTPILTVTPPCSNTNPDRYTSISWPHIGLFSPPLALLPPAA